MTLYEKPGVNIIVDTKLNDNWNPFDSKDLFTVLDNKGMRWHRYLEPNQVLVLEEDPFVVDGQCRSLAIKEVEELNEYDIIVDLS